LFCAWLAWSRYRLVIPTFDQTLGTLVACIDQTLRRLGGAPTYLLTDNAKTVTVEHVAGIAIRHPQMVAVGRHYGCTVATCVAYDPESKGGVEATVKLAKADLVPTSANLLPAYDHFAELVAACERFCERINAREHRQTRQVPLVRLATERAHLHVLPVEPHTLALGEDRLVHKDQTISWGGVRYSTPPGWRGQSVWCRVLGEELVLVGRGEHGLEEVCRHRLATPGNPSILDEHYPHHPDGRHVHAPKPKPRTPGEIAFLALGEGAHRWLVEAGAAGANRVRAKMTRAVELAHLVGAERGRPSAGAGRHHRPVRRRRPRLDPGSSGHHRHPQRPGGRRRGPLGPARHRRLAGVGPMRTPTIGLDPADAIELAELLAFMGDWLEDAPDRVGVWLARFTSYGYDLDELRADLARFAFLLGASGQRLLSGPSTDRSSPSTDR
jgi:hypothetical protein